MPNLSLRVLQFTAGIAASCMIDPAPIRSSNLPALSSPSVSTRDVISLRQFSRFSDTHSGAAIASPDGRRVAYLLRRADVQTNTYEQAWYVASALEPSNPIRIGDGGEIALSQFDDGFRSGEIAAPIAARWSPDGRRIAYIAKRQGAWQAWVSYSDGSGSEQLTHSLADVRDVRWKPDGSALFVRMNRRTRADISRSSRTNSERGWLVDEGFYPLQMPPEITPIEQATDWFEIDLSSRELRPATSDAVRSLENNSALLSSVLGGLRGGEAFDRIRQQYASRPDVAAPAVSRHNGDELIAFPVLRDPPDRVALPTSTLAFVSSADPTRTIRCSDPRCTGNIQGIWLTPDGKRVIFQKITINLEGDGVYIWNIQTGRVSELVPPRTQLERCSAAGSDLVCLFSSSTKPRTLVRLDSSRRQLIELVDPNPSFRAKRLPCVERLEWVNSRGDRTFGYLVKPDGYVAGRRYPLVVATYRAAGFFPDMTGGEYPIYQLAHRGIMVLVFNRPFSIKLTCSSRCEFANDFQDRRNVSDSLEIVIGDLIHRGLVDPNKIALTGLSDGTTLSLFEVMHGTLKIATAILSSNTYEPMDYYLASINQQRAGGIAFTPQGPDSTIYDVLAPSRNTNRFTMPILFNLADSELLASTQTLSALAALGRPYEAYMYPSEYHLKWQPAHLYWINERNLQWLEFWLLDREEANPIDPSQYQRWRQMRSNLTAQRSHNGPP